MEIVYHGQTLTSTDCKKNKIQELLRHCDQSIASHDQSALGSTAQTGGYSNLAEGSHNSGGVKTGRKTNNISDSSKFVQISLASPNGQETTTPSEPEFLESAPQSTGELLPDIDTSVISDVRTEKNKSVTWNVSRKDQSITT